MGGVLSGKKQGHCVSFEVTKEIKTVSVTFHLRPFLFGVGLRVYATAFAYLTSSTGLGRTLLPTRVVSDLAFLFNIGC